MLKYPIDFIHELIIPDTVRYNVESVVTKILYHKVRMLFKMSSVCLLEMLGKREFPATIQDLRL